ncbi:hypothetical protein CC78DRAFT_467757, partial [Lojkania enalia]
YGCYTFLDIAFSFFPKAKQRSGNSFDPGYQIFNILQDPREQGFDADSYDLIIAANFIHSTLGLNKTPQNLHRHLRPRGRLVFIRAST